MNSNQLSALIEAYATEVVDSMDVRDLCCFAIDSMCNNMDGMSEEDVLKEIAFWYDDEDRFQELLESVTVE
jgi:hypothetical protein